MPRAFATSCWRPCCRLAHLRNCSTSFLVLAFSFSDTRHDSTKVLDCKTVLCDKTLHTLTNEIEISAQRWLITSFCQDGFASTRVHERLPGQPMRAVASCTI